MPNLLKIFRQGGKGSGNFGHRGRPDQRGGSAPGTGGYEPDYKTKPQKEWHEYDEAEKMMDDFIKEREEILDMPLDEIGSNEELTLGGQYDPEWIRQRTQLELKFGKELKMPIEVGDDLSVTDYANNEIGWIEMGSDGGVRGSVFQVADDWQEFFYPSKKRSK